jgi:hypothetical protein
MALIKDYVINMEENQSLPPTAHMMDVIANVALKSSRAYRNQVPKQPLT